MNKKDWLGIAYVSICVVLWGSIGSLIDYPLLQTNLYEAGSLGQLSTFTLTALITIVLGIIFFKKVSSRFLK